MLGSIEKVVEQVDQQRYFLLISEIRQLKDDYYNSAKLFDLHRGSRYNSNTYIAGLVVGYVYSWCLHELNTTKILFLSMSSEEMRLLIERAVIEAAQADHFYDFEKEY